MYTHAYTHTHICIFTCIYKHSHIDSHAYSYWHNTHIYTHACIHAYTQTHTHTHRTHLVQPLQPWYRVRVDLLLQPRAHAHPFHRHGARLRRDKPREAPVAMTVLSTPAGPSSTAPFLAIPQPVSGGTGEGGTFRGPTLEPPAPAPVAGSQLRGSHRPRLDWQTLSYPEGPAPERPRLKLGVAPSQPGCVKAPAFRASVLCTCGHYPPSTNGGGAKPLVWERHCNQVIPLGYWAAEMLGTPILPL